MKHLDRLIGSLVVGTIALIVAADELPKLIVPATAIFGLVVIGRVVWFLTQRW
jgi:hypothetical protein